MEFASGCEQESGADRHVWNGDSVWLLAPVVASAFFLQRYVTYLLISFRCRICAVTIYRIQVTATIQNPSGPSLKEDFALIALLTSLEMLLGIISACLPILKPITKRLWSSLPKRGSDTDKPSTSGSIPVIMRISHMFTTSSKKHFSGERISSLDQSWS